MILKHKITFLTFFPVNTFLELVNVLNIMLLKIITTVIDLFPHQTFKVKVCFPFRKCIIVRVYQQTDRVLHHLYVSQGAT